MKTVVIDIETVADTQAMERCGYHHDSAVFAPWPLHRLVCASAFTIERVDFDSLRFDLRSFSLREMSEAGIAASVERAIETANQVLTYNGRSFDIPVLVTQAIKAEVPIPTLARLGNHCRPGLHEDVHDWVKSTGGGVKLSHLCAAFSIPAKLGPADSTVAEFAAMGRWLQIEHYCQTDVVATWLAAQMWQSRDDCGFGNRRWEQLAKWLKSEPQTNPLLEVFSNLPVVRSAREFPREISF